MVELGRRVGPVTPAQRADSAGDAAWNGYVPLDVVEVDLRRGLDELMARAGGERDVYAVLWWDDLPLGARGADARPAHE